MRITFLTHFPGRGGSTSMLLQLLRFFRSRGHTLAIVVGDDCDEPILKNYKVVPRRRGQNWRERMRAYVRAVEATQPQLVYAISGKDEMDVLRFVSCCRIRHVFSLEQHEYLDVPLLLAQLDGCVEAFTANTPDVLDQIHIRYGSRKAPTWVAPYRLEEAFLANLPPDNYKSVDNKGGIEICFIGRLETFQKRAHWLPKIIKDCFQSGRSISWHIYGEGPCEAQIRQNLVPWQAARTLHFHGWIDARTLPWRLVRHDIFFLCSRWEGLPIAMVEAMLCGLACVVPAIPAGITYALEKGGGWLYEARSPKSSVTALLHATEDLEILRRKKSEARRIARAMFTGSIVEEQLDRLESGITKLPFNGRVLSVERARRMRAVRAHVALRRRMLNLLRVPMAK